VYTRTRRRARERRAAFSRLGTAYRRAVPRHLHGTAQARRHGRNDDAPLLGNGDLGVSILNGIDTMTFVMNKNEFWSLAEAV